MVRVDYAGPGGTCEGMRMLGVEAVGIERDHSACATRAAAGHLTIQADLATYRPHHAPGTVWGYWASPPCQTFSNAGSKTGHGEIPSIVAAIHAENWGEADKLDSRTRHVIDAARTALSLRPEWVCMEQVPAVLPVFEAIGHRLRAAGYSVWVGILNAADFGVPQVRLRTILIATRVGVAGPPAPTHSAEPADGLFGSTQPWVSMASSLGWSGGNVNTGRAWLKGGTRADAQTVTMMQPAPTLTGASGGQWHVEPVVPADRWVDHKALDPDWPAKRPAMTLAGDPRMPQPGAKAAEGRMDCPGRMEGAIRLTASDALILQSFRPDYPVQGNKGKQFEQIGNAVPPLLAAHIIAAVTGLPAPTHALEVVS